MELLVSARDARVIEDPVFVDRNGRRRPLVVGAGLVVALALIGWLALMVVSIVAVVFSGGPSPIPPS